MSLLPLVRSADHDRLRNLAAAASAADKDKDKAEKEKADVGQGGRGSSPGVATDEILGAGLVDIVMHEVAVESGEAFC